MREVTARSVRSAGLPTGARALVALALALGAGVLAVTLPALHVTEAGIDRQVATVLNGGPAVALAHLGFLSTIVVSAGVLVWPRRTAAASRFAAAVLAVVGQFVVLVGLTGLLSGETVVHDGTVTLTPRSEAPAALVLAGLAATLAGLFVLEASVPGAGSFGAVVRRLSGRTVPSLPTMGVGLVGGLLTAFAIGRFPTGLVALGLGTEPRFGAVPVPVVVVVLTVTWVVLAGRWLGSGVDVAVQLGVSTALAAVAAALVLAAGPFALEPIERAAGAVIGATLGTIAFAIGVFAVASDARQAR